MRRQAKDLTDDERRDTLDALYTAVGTVNGRDEAKAFLRDLLTESERIMLGRRIQIARALLAGATHDEVVASFQVGKDTTMRIARWLEEKMPGYKKVIADMDKEFKKRQDKIEIARDPFSFKALKKKYPLHFLLFPGGKS